MSDKKLELDFSKIKYPETNKIDIRHRKREVYKEELKNDHFIFFYASGGEYWRAIMNSAVFINCVLRKKVKNFNHLLRPDDDNHSASKYGAVAIKNLESFAREAAVAGFVPSPPKSPAFIAFYTKTKFSPDEVREYQNITLTQIEDINKIATVDTNCTDAEVYNNINLLFSHVVKLAATFEKDPTKCLLIGDAVKRTVNLRNLYTNIARDGTSELYWAIWQYEELEHELRWLADWITGIPSANRVFELSRREREIRDCLSNIRKKTDKMREELGAKYIDQNSVEKFDELMREIRKARMTRHE